MRQKQEIEKAEAGDRGRSRRWEVGVRDGGRQEQAGDLEGRSRRRNGRRGNRRSRREEKGEKSWRKGEVRYQVARSVFIN